MNILVTGAAGVIGRELINLLKEAGANIRAVDFQEKPAAFGNIDYFRCDLSHPDSQFLFRFEPNYVFHLAADFERSAENLLFWDTNFANNILASHYTLNQAVKCPALKKIIFASSYLIYDKKLYNDTGGGNVLSEKSIINPRNICGVSKLQTERDIEFFYEKMNRRFSYACARIFRVYGQGSRDIISRWVRLALRSEELSVFDAKNSFDYIYAKDAALGLIKMAEIEEAKGIINLGTGVSASIGEVLELIRHLMPEVKSKNVKKSIFLESSCADVSKLKKKLGWIPQTRLEDGIKEIIAYEKKKISQR